MGESPDAEKWAALARAHHDRANTLLSADGYYYEGMEYWIFSIPWLVHFYDAWEHATGESLWEKRSGAELEALSRAHAVAGRSERLRFRRHLGRIADAGEARGRIRSGVSGRNPAEQLQRDVSRRRTVSRRRVAGGCRTLCLVRPLQPRGVLDAALARSIACVLPRWIGSRACTISTTWVSSTGARHGTRDATAVAFKAGPPEGHRAARLAGTVPEWALDSGHSHPDNGSFIVWANGKYLTGDTGYAGLPSARHHNTITVGGVGQGIEGQHDVWRKMSPAALDGIRIVSATNDGGTLCVSSPMSPRHTRRRRALRSSAGC